MSRPPAAPFFYVAVLAVAALLGACASPKEAILPEGPYRPVNADLYQNNLARGDLGPSTAMPTTIPSSSNKVTTNVTNATEETFEMVATSPQLSTSTAAPSRIKPDSERVQDWTKAGSGTNMPALPSGSSSYSSNNASNATKAATAPSGRGALVVPQKDGSQYWPAQ